MKIDVYDTYATYNNGEVLHFDVLLPQGSTAHQAEIYAQQWLQTLNKEGHQAQISSSRFCHSEPASPEVHSSVATNGFAILQLPNNNECI